MNSQDVLAAKNAQGDWTLFLITPIGEAAVLKAYGKKHAALIETDAAMMRSLTLTEKVAMGRGYTMLTKNADVSRHFVSEKWEEMSYEEVALNARHMMCVARKRAAEAAIHAYYMPLLDVAIAARDKVTITRLINSMPGTVQKTLIVSGLIYGDNAFPELKEEGVTLQNWHKDTRP